MTAVRAGLVVGADGSSLNILIRLVERLPMMICPSWTASLTQPIALEDVVEMLAFCCEHADTAGRVAEVGGPDVMSYRDMMRRTAKVLGRRRPMWPVPWVTPALSELWVSVVTGTSRSLVRPLIESLRHPMVVSDPWLQRRMAHPGRGFDEALRNAIEASRGWKRPVVRSVQRLPLPPGRDAKWVGAEYTGWLARLARGALRVESTGRRVTIGLAFGPPMLVLEAREATAGEDRCVLAVVGGALVAPSSRGDPRLEFRVTPDGAHVLAALQDYAPRLPWWIYSWTQAPLHTAVMGRYRAWLSRQASA